MAIGDIILIDFPFTDLTGSKLRPAVVLIEQDNDITVSFITTRSQWQEECDVLLEPDEKNGLKRTSLVRTAKIATLHKGLARGVLGELSPAAMNELNNKLKQLLQLP